MDGHAANVLQKAIKFVRLVLSLIPRIFVLFEGGQTIVVSIEWWSSIIAGAVDGIPVRARSRALVELVGGCEGDVIIMKQLLEVAYSCFEVEDITATRQLCSSTQNALDATHLLGISLFVMGS